MANMSYCRFENTLRDLADCHTALEDLFIGNARLSTEELRHAKAFIQCCADVLATVADQAALDLNDEGSVEVLTSSIEEVMDEANDAAEGC